jgi:regulator of RNase E activity RraA
MAKVKQIPRPPAEVLEPFRAFGTATISSGLREACGILRAYICGPVSYTPGLKAVGTAVTLHFLPKREDVVAGHAEEGQEATSALWAAVIAVQAGDVLVVDCRGNLQTGCLGEMLMTALHAKGAQGLVVDGCVRDLPEARHLGLPLFLRGSTPHNASHFEMYPWDYNVPIGCGGVLVMPGDIVVGDDDGVVVVPPKVAPQVIEYCQAREGREVFERLKLQQTGDLERYYPLNAEGQREYEAWLAEQAEAERRSSGG